MQPNRSRILTRVDGIQVFQRYPGIIDLTVDEDSDDEDEVIIIREVIDLTNEQDDLIPNNDPLVVNLLPAFEAVADYPPEHPYAAWRILAMEEGLFTDDEGSDGDGIMDDETVMDEDFLAAEEEHEAWEPMSDDEDLNN